MHPYFRITITFLFVFFTLIGFSASGKPTKYNAPILTIDNHPINSEYFKFCYQNYRSNHSQTTVKNYFDKFLIEQLKIADARQSHLDTSQFFIKNFSNEVRRQISHLTNSYRDSLIKDFYLKSAYRLQLNHIMIRYSLNSETDTTKSWKKAQQIEKELSIGKSIQQILKENKDSLISGGYMGTFGPFEISYDLSNVIFNHSEDSISHPIKTSFGYQIIKIVDKIRNQNQKPIDEMRLWINHRMQMIPEIRRELNNYDRNQLFNAVNTTINSLETDQQTNDQKEKLSEHKRQLIKLKDSETTYLTLKKYIEKYPELIFSKNRLHNLKDSILLQAVTIDRIWLKSHSDTTELKQFYNHYSGKRPKWGIRFKGWVVRCANQQAKDFCQNLLANYSLSPEEANDIANDNFPEQIQIDYGAYEKHQDPVVDYFVWNGQKPSRFIDFDFIRGNQIKPEAKTLNEAKGFYLYAYQQVLEKRWIKRLKHSFSVKRNHKILKQIHE